MNPNTETPPGMHLPEPLQTDADTSHEKLPASPFSGAPEQPPMSPQSAPGLAQPQLPQQLSGSAGGQAAASQQVQNSLTAADDDKIEPEWIVNTKQIIAATQNDPSEQNRQLAAFKADYIQKRYGKTVKLSE